MILGDRKSKAPPPDGPTTLDDIFQRAAARRPDAIALTDPPNRAAFTGGPPRRLTYVEADRAIAAIAQRLHRLGLQPDSVIGIMLPNTVEAVLTLLGVVRAGMIAAPVPLLWRQAETAAALRRIEAKAIITASRVDGFDTCMLAMRVAAALFPGPLRRRLWRRPAGRRDPVRRPADGRRRPKNPSPPSALRTRPQHVALVTWDVTPDGTVAVARNHTELIAGGLAVLLEGGLQQDATILGCCATSSFAGLALTMVPWLLSGGTLALHHGFDAEAFATQCRDGRCDTIIAPGALVPRLAAAGLLAHPELRNVLAVWRAPERLSISPAWRHPSASLTDVLVFGETALLGLRRDADGRPAALPAGNVAAPRGSAQAVRIAEIARSPAGTLALRGPMVPRHAFPPGAERLAPPYLRADKQGFVDTGYSCRLDRATDSVTVTGPPPGLVSVGGYRFMLSELEELVRRVDGGATLAALPDALAGHRLAGVADNAKIVRAGLMALGANPLVADAFAGRRRPSAA